MYVVVGLALNRWTPGSLARFAWCARRLNGKEGPVARAAQQEQDLASLPSQILDAESQFESYVSRALINADPKVPVLHVWL